MCFGADISKKSFSVGVISGLLLMAFGKEKYKDTNTVIGLFFIFVSLMQYIEYMLWTDLECKGSNLTAGIYGYFFNYLQPTVFFLLSVIFFKKFSLTSNDLIPLLLNIYYFIYIIDKFNKYKNGNLCSKVNEGHLEWAWRDNDSYAFYHIVTLINIVYYFNDINGVVAFLLSYFFMFYSELKYSQHVGELWCFLVTSVPSIVLFCQKVFNI
jgi:hypothetical protein